MAGGASGGGWAVVRRSSLEGERQLKQEDFTRIKHARPPSATAAAAGTPPRACRRQQFAPIAANDFDQEWKHAGGCGGTLRPSAVREGVEQGWLEAREARRNRDRDADPTKPIIASPEGIGALRSRRPLAAHCRPAAARRLPACLPNPVRYHAHAVQ